MRRIHCPIHPATPYSARRRPRCTSRSGPRASALPAGVPASPPLPDAGEAHRQHRRARPSCRDIPATWEARFGSLLDVYHPSVCCRQGGSRGEVTIPSFCASQSFHVTVGKVSVAQVRSTESPPPVLIYATPDLLSKRAIAPLEMVIAAQAIRCTDAIDTCPRRSREFRLLSTGPRYHLAYFCHWREAGIALLIKLDPWRAHQACERRSPGPQNAIRTPG